MDFKAWVRANGGADIIGKKLGVTGAAVRFWMRKHNTPKMDTVLKIQKMSKGKVTLKDLYVAERIEVIRGYKCSKK